MGCVSQDSEGLVSERGKQSRGNPMQKVLVPIQRVRFTLSTLRQASIREKKGPSRGKNTCRTSSSGRSLTPVKIGDLSHEEAERQQRCAQSKAWNLAKKHVQAQRERQSYILLARGGVGTPGCVNKRTRGKRVCNGLLDSGASMHVVSKWDFWLCWVGDHEDIEEC